MKKTNDPINLRERTDLIHQKITPYNHKKYYSKWSKDFWVEKFKNKFRKKRLFMVNMILRNGKSDRFTVSVSGNYFQRHGGTYYVDSDLSRTDTHSGLNELYYHQDCSIPFRIDIDIDKLFKAVGDDDNGIVKALNPNNLKGFINSQVIEKVLKGQELSQEMKMIKMFIIINMILTGAILLLFGKSQGWF